VGYKSCPQCGTEAPMTATRCKSCFFDYTAQRGRSWGPIVLLATIALMPVIAASVFLWISYRPLETRNIVNPESMSIKFVTTYRGGPTTETVPFADVREIEHRHVARGSFELSVITSSGDRKLLATSPNEPLTHEAEQYGELMKKPVVQVDETGLDKLAQPE
jgi:hypothetical protein